MDNKLDKLMGIVIGLCLIACGLLFVIRDYFTLPFGSIICMMIGFVCVVYYFDRKRVSTYDGFNIDLRRSWNCIKTNT